MNQVRDKKVLITGASSGFGEACANVFASHGAGLTLWARRFDRLQELKDDLEKQYGIAVRVDEVDVRDRKLVVELAGEMGAAGEVPDVLVNNAGLASGLDPFHEGDFDDWDKMVDTNITGLLNVSRAFLPAMVERNSGHVVNIGSIAGHVVYPKGNVYNATKFAVRALTEGMNIDLLGTKIRVSSVDPGAAKTEFSKVRFHGDEERAAGVYNGFEPLTAADVADAVFYVVNAPEHVNIANLVIMPTDQRNPYMIRREGM
jgi:serine 3-dehydrogenase